MVYSARYQLAKANSRHVWRKNWECSLLPATVHARCTLCALRRDRLAAALRRRRCNRWCGSRAIDAHSRAIEQGTVFLVWPLAAPARSILPSQPQPPTCCSRRYDLPKTDANNPPSTRQACSGRSTPTGERFLLTRLRIGAESAFDAGSQHEHTAARTRHGNYPPQWPKHIGPTFRDLPLYTRSLLKIRVPFSVTLAEKKQPVGQILELGPARSSNSKNPAKICSI